MAGKQIVVQHAPTLFDALDTYIAGKAQHTKRAYLARLRKFIAWREQHHPTGEFLAQLNKYVEHLQASGMSPRSVQVHVNTIKGLIRTAAILDDSGTLLNQLPRLDMVKPPKVRGELQGNRLSDRQRQALIDLPGTDTHKGRRDTAILALLAVCGLRRSEITGLSWMHIAELDGHKVIQNLRGKHGRVRTIKLPIPLWRRIVEYAALAGLDNSPEAPVFVSIGKGDAIRPGRRIPTSSIEFMVKHYVARLNSRGIETPSISPHDLRRTAAKLARDGGATIEQVQVMLGHASPQTTSAYIGETLDLDDHAVDYARVKIP